MMKFEFIKSGVWATDIYRIVTLESGEFQAKIDLGDGTLIVTFERFKEAVAHCEKHKRKNKQSEYLKLHRESGIKEGDWVEVVRAVPSYDKGWGEIWNHQMSELVGGRRKIIKDLGINGFHIEGSWHFPAHALRKLTRTIRPYTMAEFVREAVKRCDDSGKVQVRVNGVLATVLVYDTSTVAYAIKTERGWDHLSNVTWPDGTLFGVEEWE